MKGCNLSKPPGTGLDMDCVKVQSNEIYSDTFCVFSVFVCQKGQKNNYTRRFGVQTSVVNVGGDL